jgi:hypothetical protein
MSAGSRRRTASSAMHRSTPSMWRTPSW